MNLKISLRLESMIQVQASQIRPQQVSMFKAPARLGRIILNPQWADTLRGCCHQQGSRAAVTKWQTPATLGGQAAH